MTLLVAVSDRPATLPERRVKRDKIVGLEHALREELDVGSFPPSTETVTHHHADRLYGREMFIPAGSLIVGKIHRYPCVNIIASGKIKVVSEWGDEVFVGPHVFVSLPGAKRAVLALTDVVWVTVHPNFDNERDMEVLEKTLIAGSYVELTHMGDVE